MKRREFITLLGGAAAAWPLAARGQQAAIPVVGFLSSGSPDANARFAAAFRQGLNEADHVESQSPTIEFYWAEGHPDRLAALAADLVRRRVSVIVAAGNAATRAAKAATNRIPVVFNVGGDPVKFGLIASLNRPGGNLTGISRVSAELIPKRLELLREVLPSTSVMALLVNPTNPATESVVKDAHVTARSLGLQLDVLTAITEVEIDMAFSTMAQPGAGGLLIGNDPFFSSITDKLAALTVRHAVPAIFQYREFVAAGGLMSYGASLTDAFRQVGVYTSRILKGAKPADLPVQQPTKFELVINMKTAKALGIDVPPSLLARADEVIE